MNTFSGKRTISRQFMPKAYKMENAFFTQYDNYEEVMHIMKFHRIQSIICCDGYYDKDGYHKYYTLREDVLTLTKMSLVYIKMSMIIQM